MLLWNPKFGLAPFLAALTAFKASYHGISTTVITYEMQIVVDRDTPAKLNNQKLNLIIIKLYMFNY